MSREFIIFVDFQPRGLRINTSELEMELENTRVPALQDPATVPFMLMQIRSTSGTIGETLIFHAKRTRGAC